MDLKKIQGLAQLLHDSRLTALELSEDGATLRLERHAPRTDAPSVLATGATSPSSSTAVVTPVAATVPAAASAPSVVSPVNAAPQARTIKASMQGILHLTPAPGEPSFVRVGDQIAVEQVVCVIEAMKMFNTVEAELAGQVVAILAEAGTEVKPGQPLFQIE